MIKTVIEKLITPKAIVVTFLIITALLALYLVSKPGGKIATVTHPDSGSESKPLVNPDARKSDSPYPVHSDIIATVFWVGENADESNGYIHNRSSAWMSDWVSAFGGIDTAEKRCGYKPCGFTPKENTFYFALPFGDYTESGLKPESQLRVIPWYDEAQQNNESLLKNRWIEVKAKNKTAYAQWEDVGPFMSDDAEYVFGTARPQESRAGLDMSPSLADYLGVDGRGTVSWKFVRESDVPNGPWKTLVTHSAPDYR